MSTTFVAEDARTGTKAMLDSERSLSLWLCLSETAIEVT
jgi:hypothetical protein